MAEENLTKDDLVLLMGSYENMIRMHHTILDQTNHTIEKLNGIIDKQDSIATKQGSLCTSLDGVAKKLDDCASALKDSANAVQSHSLKSVEDHGKIVNKVHLGWVGMGSILISGMGIIFTILHYGNDIIRAIERIPSP